MSLMRLKKSGKIKGKGRTEIKKNQSHIGDMVLFSMEYVTYSAEMLSDKKYMVNDAFAHRIS